MKITSIQSFLCATTLVGFTALSGRSENADPVQPIVGEAEPEFDRFSFRAGAFLLSSVKTTLRLEGPDGQEGDEIDFEEDLGGDNSLNVARVDGEWRFAGKHKIALAWFDIDQSTTHALTGEIEWGGETYPIDTVVETHFGTTISKISYGYAFVSRGRHEVFALIGAHVTRLEAGISAPNLGLGEAIGVTAPLPVLGLEWKARISEKLMSQVSYEYFGISLDDRYSGNLSDFQAILDYRLSDHWSICGGYNRYVMRASVEGDNLKLTLKHSYNGLLAFVGVHF